LRRDQSNQGSQIIRNFAYNPSFEASGISTILRTNIAQNPSLETAGATTAVRTNLLTNPSAEVSATNVNVRTNLATNPSFEGASGTVNVRTNFFVNPSMETGTTSTVIRTNLALNPNATTSTGWFAANGIAASTSTNQAGGPVNGNTYARVTATGTGTGTGYFGMAYGQPGAGNGASVTAGTAYIASAYIRATMANFTTQPAIRLRWKDAAGVTLSDLPVTATGATSGAWVRLSSTGTAPASAAYVEIIGGYLSIDMSTITVGDTVDVSGVLVEATNAFLPYFDGTIASVENLVKSFTATAQSLTTITTGISYSGSTWSRAATPTGTGSSINRMNLNLADLTGGEAYTTSVTLANDQAFSQQINLDWCDLAVATFTLAPGEIRRVQTTATRSVYDSVYRFSDLSVTQSATEGRSILFKDWLIEKGTTTGEYYTGLGDFTYVWTGTANASTSTQKATGIVNWSLASTASTYQSSVQKNSYGKSLAVLTRGGNGDGVYASDVTAIIPGGSYTFSAWIKQTTAHPLTMDFRWKDSGNGILSDTLVSVSPTVGTWTRVSATAVAPTGAVALLQPMLRIYAAHTGTTFYVDDALIERASGLGAYFDGATPAAGDFTYVWSGTANGSWAYQQAPAITAWSNRWFGNGGGNGAMYQAKGGLSGTYARKLWTTANTGATMDAGIGTAASISVAASTVYTFSAWVRASFGQYLNYYIDWRDASNAVISATQMSTGTLVTANAWTRLSVTATSPSNAVAAYFILGPYAQAIATPYGGTLDFDNVLIEAAPAVQDYFDGANPIQNLVTNPSFTTDTTGWTASLLVAGNGRATTKSYAGVGSIWGVANDNQGDSMFTNTTGITVTPFATYTVSAYAYVPAGVVASDFRGSNRNLWAVSFDASTPTTATANLDFTKTNQWQRISTTITIPSNSTSGLSVRLYCPANALGIYWDAIQVEKTPTLNPYYEGTGDYNYVWAGTANASVSYQQAPGVAGMTSTATLGIAYQSKTYGSTSGTKSIRITATHVSNGDSFAEINGMLSGYTFKANTTYTISGNRTILAPQTNINGTTHFRINIGGSELTPTLVAAVSNVAGTQRVVARFTTGAGTSLAFIRLYDGSYFGGGDVWWDDIVLEEWITNGSYFDGANPLQNLITNPSFDSSTTGWTPPNGSTLAVSTAQALVGTQSALVTVATGSSNFSGIGFNIALSANTTYTFSGYVYIPATGGVPVLASVQGANFLTVGSAPVSATGVWNRLSVTFTTGLAQTYALYFLNGATATAGQVFYLDATMLERSYTLNPYYAGLGDFTYAWTGTANASTSEQRGVLVSDRQSVGSSSTMSYQSSVRSVSGSKSGAIFLKASLGADSTLMYPVNEYYTDSGTGRLTPSVLNTWSLYVWVPSGSGTVRLQDISTGTIGAPNTTFDQWERISVTFLAGASGPTFLRLRANTTVPAGTVIWWDNELLEGSPVIQSYFDGSTGTVGDFTHAWVGTANASSSTKSAVTVSTDVTASASSLIQSSDWGASNKSLRIIPNSSLNQSFGYWDFPTIVGATYTFMATARLSAPITGTLESRALKLMARSGSDYFSSAIPNAIGVTPLRLTFKALAASSRVYVWHGGSAGSGDVWYDNIMFTEGDYSGDYVDGTKPFSKWESSVNTSTSIGYSPQLFDLAGAPSLQQIGVGDSASPTVDGFAARTIYLVYEVYANANSWQVPLYYGSTAPTMGLTVQTAAAGNFTVSPRLDFTSGGDINKGFNFSNGRTLARRHVLAMSLPQGLTSLAAHGDGVSLTGPGIVNPGSVGWTNGQLRCKSVADVKSIYASVYYAEHDAATRLAVSRYLGNKYGANVA